MKYYIPTGDWYLNDIPYHQMMERIGHTYSTLSDAEFLLLPGGADLGKILHRDDYESYCYNYFKDKKLPIIGICRGMQLMLHLSGENIICHIPSILTEVIHTTKTGNYTGVSSWHITEQGFFTNSRHHQGFLEVSDWDVLDRTHDGIIEAVKRGNELGVQWHPECDEMIETYAFRWFEEELKKILL
jgi:gamma-glutamyl-gamma-aminobutyrate hydrolase PuuD